MDLEAREHKVREYLDKYRNELSYTAIAYRIGVKDLTTIGRYMSDEPQFRDFKKNKLNLIEFIEEMAGFEIDE